MLKAGIKALQVNCRRRPTSVVVFSYSFDSLQALQATSFCFHCLEAKSAFSYIQSGEFLQSNGILLASSQVNWSFKMAKPKKRTSRLCSDKCWYRTLYSLCLCKSDEFFSYTVPHIITYSISITYFIINTYSISHIFILYHITSTPGLIHQLVRVWDWCLESWSTPQQSLSQLSNWLKDLSDCPPIWRMYPRPILDPRKKHTVSKKELLFKELQWIRSEKETAPKESIRIHQFASELKTISWNMLKPFKQHVKPSFSAPRSATFGSLMCAKPGETVSSTSRATNLARNVAGYAAMSCSFCQVLWFAHQFNINSGFSENLAEKSQGS